MSVLCELPRAQFVYLQSLQGPPVLSTQYTIRGIPSAVDVVLRRRVRAGEKSLNQAAVDALTEGAGIVGKPRKRRDLADIARTWKTDKTVESALAAQDRVDKDRFRTT